jgi:cephalosporin hydroxylase
MKITINTKKNTIVSFDEKGKEKLTPIYSQEGFKLLSSVWLKQEWNQLHWQSFSWFGFQIWQFPDDLLRLQEVIVALKPDVIVETGVSQGGSSIFFATLCRLIGNGQVISIDITIPPALRERVEQSPFADLITLIEGDSASHVVLEQIRHLVGSNKTVFVFLDSDHSKDHVLRELNAYAGLVTSGSYIVAADGVMQSLTDTPYGDAKWAEDNPAAAAREFAASHPEFVIKRPEAIFGEEYVVEELTYWPDAWLYRLTE